MNESLWMQWWASPNARTVTLGISALAAIAAYVGSFSFLRRRSLSGDAVAHAVLPGVCLAFLLTGQKHPAFLLMGAFATAFPALLVVEAVSERTKLKPDAAIAIVLSVFFGFGVTLLTFAQRLDNAAGLDKFLFGQAAALTPSDVYAFAGIGGVCVVLTLLFHKELVLVAFDKEYARATGMPVRRIEMLTTALTVTAVVVGVSAVGVVLMAALTITPSAAARYWTDRAVTMQGLAAALGALGGAVGAGVSFFTPATPTGPAVVIALTLFAIASVFLSPQTGIFSRFLQKIRSQNRVFDENILKTLYHLGETDQRFFASRSLIEIARQRPFPLSRLVRRLDALARRGYVKKSSKLHWTLTEKGYDYGKRITKRHRLWEIYLSQTFGLAPDHVHEAAETMEHFITPELEAELVRILNRPEQDPHGKSVPY
jgi:manganese/zinc/iron transport system permease protein